MFNQNLYICSGYIQLIVKVLKYFTFMVKNLQKYLSIFTAFLLFTNLAFAQVDKGKSRLDIGKKPTTPKTVALQKYAFNRNMPKEVKLDKPTAINLYFRNALLSNTTRAIVVKNGNNEALVVEKSVIPTPEINTADKFFANEKLSVSNIYPNPANDFAIIDYTIYGNINDANITFYNIIGNEVEAFELDKNERKLRVKTSNWDSGMYMYQLVVDGKKLATKKLLVRHN